MEVHVLASGSTGNAIFVKTGGVNLLIDAGISARRIKNALAEVGTSVEELNGVFITHEHSDHIKGLPTLLKKYRIPLYARPATWEALPFRDLLPGECYRELCATVDIGPVKVEPFSISHDAADPVGYSIYCGAAKCSLATDLGFVTETVKKALAMSDILVLESNHDLEMLRQGAYPWSLKRRIMSNRGHLSNIDAAWTLARLPRKSHTHVFLAHMSQENNCPQLAHQTVSTILEDQGFCLGTDLTLHLTFPDQTASLAV